MLRYKVNGKEIFIKPKSFEGTQNQEFYENQIFKSLSKIGIEKQFINIIIGENEVRVIWIINQQKFEFVCSTQESPTKNLGAISQAIQDDIRQITRGIKTIDLVMKQYETNSKPLKKSNNLLNFESKEEDKFNVEELKLDKKINENKELDPKYEYLLKESNDSKRRNRR